MEYALLIAKLKLATATLLAMLATLQSMQVHAKPMHFGGAKPDPTVSIDPAIQHQQDAYFSVHEKYQRIAPTTKDGVTTFINEYVAPTGAGYEVLYSKFTTCEQTKKDVYGPEARLRAYDWTTCPPVFISSTSTNSVN